jgi:glycosyltransferase involved in cell wall biosynthesis
MGASMHGEQRAHRRHVLVLTTSFPRYDGDPSGHFVAAEARSLAERGARVSVVCAGDGPRRDRRGPLEVWWAGGGRLFSWPGAQARLQQAPGRIVGAAEAWWGVRRALDEVGSVDRAVAHWLLPCAWPLARNVSAPLEAVAHGADVRLLIALPKALRERILGAVAARDCTFRFVADASREALLAVCSPRLRSRMRALSRVEACAIDVPPLPSRAELRASLGVAPSALMFVVVGRLIASKRVALAVDAVAAVDPGAQLVVVGNGPERAPLERRARLRGVSTRFVGLCPRPRALEWIAASDALLSTSEHEAAPTVVREARAMQVPVVATVSGDVARWARSDSGIHCVDAHPMRLAEALARLSHTPTRREPGILRP